MFIYFYKVIKYFIYFCIFLNISIINIINYKLTNKLNDKLLIYLYYSVDLNGCILIKLFQWITTNLEMLGYKENDNVYKLFSLFYENCYIHDISYTKKIFIKEFDIDFDSTVILDNSFKIKSGSIAQVYKASLHNNIDIAIKVVHPDIYYQLIFPIFFIKLYKFLVKKISFLNCYDTVFIFDTFFENIITQTNMLNEYNNMMYFYNEYIDNPYIIIPEPLLASNNILIMKYIDGYKLDEITSSIFEKSKICCLFNLFLKDAYYFKDYYHSDLHDSNWKVVKYNDEYYQLIIYDFGYISSNKIKNQAKNITYANDICDTSMLCGEVYDKLLNCKYTKEEFLSKFFNYLHDTNIIYREPFCDDVIRIIYKFLVINNIYLEPDMFELFISMMLFKKYVTKYLQLKKIGVSNSNNLVSNYLNSIEMCTKYNIFPELCDFYNRTYIDNPEIKNSYVYSDNYLNDLNNSKNSIDI